MIEINVRKAEVSDFNQINSLFKELAKFELLPGKRTITVDRMIEEKVFLIVLPQWSLCG